MVFPEINKWIEAFLLGRKYRVRVNGKFSDWYSVISCIPQGSVGLVYWDHFYLYYILMIWQTWIQVITGQTYICLLMMQKYVDILHVSDLAGDSG